MSPQTNNGISEGNETMIESTDFDIEALPEDEVVISSQTNNENSKEEDEKMPEPTNYDVEKLSGPEENTVNLNLVKIAEKLREIVESNFQPALPAPQSQSEDFGGNTK